MEQLPLGVRLRAASTFASFHPGDNAALLAALEARTRGERLPPLWLWSVAGAGRTHLLQACCARTAEQGRRAGLVPLEADWLAPAMLQGLEQLDLLCIDDLQVVAGEPQWERALFVLYNEFAERGGNLVLTATAAPAALLWGLADLASRLSASVVWQVRPLPEAAQPAALLARAAALGVELPEETLQYLLRRLPRDLAALCATLDRLDAAALARQRRLTVPFARAVLELKDG